MPASTASRMVSKATGDTVAWGPVTATVGVTAGRRAEEQALLLERAGLRVVIGPAMGTALTTEDGPLRTVTDALIARPPAYVVADTGIGIRSWLAAAEGWGSRDALLAALARARIACRGPKAQGALRSAGLAIWWQAPGEQLAEVQARLLSEPLAGAVMSWSMPFTSRTVARMPVLELPFA